MNSKSLWSLLFSATLLFTFSSAEERVSDHFSLPPEMEKLFGDPRIHHVKKRNPTANARLIGFASYDPLYGFIPRLTRSRIIVSGADNLTKQELAHTVAAPLLNCFYNEILSMDARSRYAQEMLMQELVPVTRERFLTLGSKVLYQGSSHVAWFDNWWKVRMGLPLTPSNKYHLLMVNLQMDDPGFQSSTGHFCVGLRERRGNTEKDVLIEFRAPWYIDRIPTLTEGMNFNNTLPLSAYPENLYDWLYTQTELRNNNSKIWFLPIAKEQVQLFHDFLEIKGVHKAGQYGPIRLNCASLGLLFLQRIQPFDTPVLLEKGLADLPFKSTARFLHQYGDEGTVTFPLFTLDSITRDLGREPTAKSKMHPALPDRRNSRAFQELRKWEREFLEAPH